MENTSDICVMEDGSRTPRHPNCKTTPVACPGAPRKKRAVYLKQRHVPPKEGYFQPPDLEIFFNDVALRMTREPTAPYV